MTYVIDREMFLSSCGLYKFLSSTRAFLTISTSYHELFKTPEATVY